MTDMDEPEVVPEPESVPAPVPEPAAEAESEVAAQKPRRSRAWLWFLLLLIILAVAGWLGWQWWQQHDADQAATRAQQQRSAQREQGLSALQTQLGTLRTQVESLRSGNESVRSQLGADTAAATALQQQLAGMETRLAQLESVLADFSRQRLSGRDSAGVNEVESLLQLAQQRYVLFADAESAMHALALADARLAAMGNPRFASVRQSIQNERAALAATHPEARSATVARLQDLRAQWQALPLKAPQLDQAAPDVEQSVWQRVGNTLANLVRVRRESAADPVSSMDASLARQLGALNLAEAQAALLAADRASFHSALTRSLSQIEHAFDIKSADVRKLRDELQGLQIRFDKNLAPVQLGAALQALRNLRAIDVMTFDAPEPVRDPFVPSAAGSAAAPSESVVAPANAGSDA